MTTVLYEPAEAVAAGRCATARILGDAPLATHPRTCGWCVYPVRELLVMVDGFLAWAGWDEHRQVFARYDVEAWHRLPHPEQERDVIAAQDFEPDPITELEQRIAAPVAPPREPVLASTHEDEPWQL